MRSVSSRSWNASEISRRLASSSSRPVEWLFETRAGPVEGPGGTDEVRVVDADDPGDEDARHALLEAARGESVDGQPCERLDGERQLGSHASRGGGIVAGAPRLDDEGVEEPETGDAADARRAVGSRVGGSGAASVTSER